MMDNRSGKGLTFVKRIYLPRVIGLGIGLFSVMAGMATLTPPVWVWVLVLFSGLLWPHVAYFWASRSTTPYQAEQRNLLLDSLMGGFWAAAMHFNPLPSVTVLSMMTMNNRRCRRQADGRARGAGPAGRHACRRPGARPRPAAERHAPAGLCLPADADAVPAGPGLRCATNWRSSLADHKRRLSALTLTDSLTGLLNHGAWKDLLLLKFHACKQQQGGAVIALIDIDHFKTINDTFGHVVGDCVLRQLSAELRRNPARWRPGRSLRRRRVLRHPPGHQRSSGLPRAWSACANGSPTTVTRSCRTCASASASACQLSRLASSPRNTGFEQADKALYTAKHAGRDQVNFARGEAATLRLAYPD